MPTQISSSTREMRTHKPRQLPTFALPACLSLRAQPHGRRTHARVDHVPALADVLAHLSVFLPAVHSTHTRARRAG